MLFFGNFCVKKQSLIDNLLRGVDEVIPEDSFRSILEGDTTLTIKLGFDPTAPDLHLGHSVVLGKLKILQDLGHKVVFIVGDFTASIGDPSGRSKTRPALTVAEIKENALTYASQIYKILDKDKTTLVYNSTWLGKMSAKDMIELTSGQSVARMLERDDFAKRFKANAPISIHEFIYPLLQGLDSVEIDADLELGGRDQKFNLLMGRELQKKHGKKQQAILMMPLLEGTDGVKKMSKSLGNTIDLALTPSDMFGKIMSISDDLMWRYYELLSYREQSDLDDLKQSVSNGTNPRDVKFELALEIVARFHDADKAKKALEEFKQRFAKGELPSNIDTVTLNNGGNSMPLANAIRDSGMAPSTSQALRLLKQGGVKINQERVVDNLQLEPSQDLYLVQVGKRNTKYIKIV